MGWEDRPYYRDRDSSGGVMGGPVGWLLNGSIPMGTWFDIRVRMHVTMVIFIGLQLLFAGTRNGLGVQNAVTSMTILFFSVLLHEFGHCFGARIMGGDAREILMWPLGGLAFTEPPHRPWASFVTTACGPLVNVAICLLTAAAIAAINGSFRAIPWFPVGQGLREYVQPEWPWTSYYLWWIFLVNWALLMFNLLLIFYPFDGGRLIQELLWMKIGYYRSMKIATVLGMIGAVVVAILALFWASIMLLMIAGFGFYTCYRQRQAILSAGPYAFTEDDTDYSIAYEKQRRAQRNESARASRRAEKEREAAQAEQQKIDAILAKVSAEGMNSLTGREKRTLAEATERQRQAELKRASRAR